VLHWNAHSTEAGDLVKADVAEIERTFSLAVTSLLSAMQASLPELRKADKPAILVTGGTLSRDDPGMDALAAQWKVMGLAVAKAAQHKLVGVLNTALKSENVYVGEVTVGGIVKGSAADRGGATLEPSAIAQRFWDIYQARNEAHVLFS
jgi:NADP-dependent 3-hydroxy acid dehydrogenase YdfG